ncbi:hypothetical protein RIF29_32169 [Crotalaria pallida]|uniref:GUN4-like domain-containing protein n=1 Tax=Crotalaria pallida TaxID=3830 RepID=A0AAN9HXZ3_CROPI
MGCDLASPKFSQSQTSIAFFLMSSSLFKSPLPTFSLSHTPSTNLSLIHNITHYSTAPYHIQIKLSHSHSHSSCSLKHFFSPSLFCAHTKKENMATNSLHSIQHRSLIKPHLQSNNTTLSSSSLFLKPITTNNTNLTLFSSSSSSYSSNSYVTFSISQTTSSSITTTTTPSTSQTTISYDLLTQHLSSKNYQLADEETRRLLIVLAGEAAQKRGYVFFSEVQFISETDLKTIDELWREHSDNKFGYSVQKRIFEKKANEDFTNFFIKVGWMKKLDTEIEQYNYRAFPSEFIWELNDETPEGHLPLTNALRGTRLLYNIFNHPAFDAVQEEQAEVVAVENNKDNASSSNPLAKRIFKTDYSF